MSTEATSTSALDEFNSALSRYLVWTSKGQGPATEDRAKRVRFELFRQFKKIAQTAQGLREELTDLGYAFKRRINPATGKAFSPEDEVRARIQSLRYLSISWIFNAWRLRRTGQNATFSAVAHAQGIIGQAIVATADGTASPYVELTSFLEGVVAQNRARNLVDLALRAQVGDMAEYFAKKHQEWLQGNFQKTFNVALGVRLA